VLSVEPPFDQIEELHEAELDCLKAMFKSGLAVALPAALHYCVKHRLAIPLWISSASAQSQCDGLRGDIPKKRGRASPVLAGYRQVAIDYCRYDAVVTTREKQKELLAEAKSLRAGSNVPRGLLKRKEDMLAWVGRSLLHAFDCAAMILAGSEAGAGPDAMKASYRRVKRHLGDPRLAMSYHILDPEFLRNLKLQAHFGARRGRKIVELYDLTL
jgi:hypothetical protein